MIKPLVHFMIIFGFACNTGESRRQLDIEEFSDSACKEHDSSLTNVLLTGRNRTDFTGLECIAWRNSTADRLDIDFINATASCGFPPGQGSLWKPSATQTENGSIEISVEWNFPSQNACGSCLQDFLLRVNGVNPNSIQTINFSTRACTGQECPWTRSSIKVPFNEMNEGIQCRYINWMPQWWRPNTGSLHLPAVDDSCEPGLLPTPNGLGANICMATCLLDQDCPLQPLLTCQNGTCRLKNS